MRPARESVGQCMTVDVVIIVRSYSCASSSLLARARVFVSHPPAAEAGRLDGGHAQLTIER